MPPNGFGLFLTALPIAFKTSNNFNESILTSSTTKISVLFHNALANLFFLIFVTSCSIVPFPRPMPAHEWSVFALQFNKTAAQPVIAVT